jgi:hypothetical protein
MSLRSASSKGPLSSPDNPGRVCVFKVYERNLESRTRGENHGMLNRVLEFANISWHRMFDQSLHRY